MSIVWILNPEYLNKMITPLTLYFSNSFKVSIFRRLNLKLRSDRLRSRVRRGTGQRSDFSMISVSFEYRTSLVITEIPLLRKYYKKHI